MNIFIQMALGAGAENAVMLSRNEIALSADFRAACEVNRCGMYGRCWMCPPDVGEIDALMERIRQYPCALWYQSIHALEDSFDLDGMREAGMRHIQISQRLEHALREKYPIKNWLHLTCGGCRLCETCARQTNEPCRHPDWALPSLESYGVDVYNTTKNTPLRYINGQNTVTYFGMVCLEDEACIR